MPTWRARLTRSSSSSGCHGRLRTSSLPPHPPENAHGRLDAIALIGARAAGIAWRQSARSWRRPQGTRCSLSARTRSSLAGSNLPGPPGYGMGAAACPSGCCWVGAARNNTGAWGTQPPARPGGRRPTPHASPFAPYPACSGVTRWLRAGRAYKERIPSYHAVRRAGGAGITQASVAEQRWGG